MSRGRPSTKRRNIKAFHVPDEMLETYEKFKGLCIMEGESVSGKLVGYIREYVQAHYPGNPQLPLTKFTKPATQPSPPKKAEIDYSEMTDEELQRRLRWTKNMVTKWLIMKELEKRGHMT